MTAPGERPARDILRAFDPDIDRPPPPGRQALALAAVVIGLMLLGVQLWLLTVALDRYLSGKGSDGWILALFSGLVFLGGLLALRILSSWPPSRH